MDRVMYLAAHRANQIMQAQRVNSNNLSNISTTAFRADLMVYVSDEASRSDTRIYSTIKEAAVNFDKGALKSTGRQLDLAINGDGWIAVQSLSGVETYTRDGNFHISSTGTLMTSTGEPVLGDAGPLVIPPFEKLDIGNDGTISIQPLGQSAATLAIVGRIKLVNPENAELMKGMDGSFVARNGTSFEADASVSVVSGSLETSNVNAVSSMVSMIELARQFEVQMKMLDIAKMNDEASARQLRMGG